MTTVNAADSLVTPWIDEFGQNMKESWPGKIGDAVELTRVDQAENRSLQKLQQRLPRRDTYNGWLAGENLEATGFFRLENDRGRWWFVTPEGHKFFSTGIDCITSKIQSPLNDKTRSAYSWLPDADHRDSTENGVSMYTSNLIRKWGQDSYVRRFQQKTNQRMLVWGFSSLGNWCNSDIIDLYDMAPELHDAGCNVLQISAKTINPLTPWCVFIFPLCIFIYCS